jgi:hypothetical protein
MTPALPSCASLATTGSTDDSVGPETCPSAFTAKMSAIIAPRSVPMSAGVTKQSSACRL